MVPLMTSNLRSLMALKQIYEACCLRVKTNLVTRTEIIYVRMILLNILEITVIENSYYFILCNCILVRTVLCDISFYKLQYHDDLVD